MHYVKKCIKIIMLGFPLCLSRFNYRYCSTVLALNMKISTKPLLKMIPPFDNQTI